MTQSALSIRVWEMKGGERCFRLKADIYRLLLVFHKFLIASL